VSLIYDFYGRYLEDCPIIKEQLKSPNRDEMGYYWVFEDYMILGQRGTIGVPLEGFLLETPEDYNFFRGIVHRFFIMSVINSVVKNAALRAEDFNTSDYGAEFIENLHRNVVIHFSNKVDEKTESIERFLENTKLSIKRSKVWISLSYYWTDSIERDIKNFWGNDVSVKRFPNEFESICREGVIQEVLSNGPIEFNKDMAWEALSFEHPKLVGYIEKEVVERLGVTYLKDLNDIGLF
jgi:hypothetical protein